MFSEKRQEMQESMAMDETK